MERRKRKLVRMELQLKVVFVTLFVASLVLLINFQLSLASLWSLSSRLTGATSIASALEELRRSLIGKFLISVGIAVPLAAAVGILYSFRFCGPIYRFKKYFKELLTGRWDTRCFLRQGDDLQDVCESIRLAMDSVQQFLRENRAIVDGLTQLGAEGGLRAEGVAAEKLRIVMAQAQAAARTYQERFPEPEEQVGEAEPAKPTLVVQP